MAPRISLCPAPCLRLTPLLPGSKAAVPGSLEGGAAAGTAPLRTPLLTYLILPLAPGAGRTQLQPSTRAVLQTAASLVNGPSWPGLFCDSFPRCWDLGTAVDGDLGPSFQSPGGG